MNIKYSDFLEVCKAFYKLPKHDFLVFEFLAERDVFCGTYTDIAKNIGVNISNVRKACINLETIGVITILHQSQTKVFFIHAEWYKNLLKNADKLPGFKAETYKRKKGEK